MGHRNNAQKRRQTRTHQHRLDAKNRRAKRVQAQPSRPTSLVNDDIKTPTNINPTLLVVEEEFRKLLRDEGEVSILCEEWIPISQAHPFVEFTAEFSLLGFTTRLRAVIDDSAVIEPEIPEQGTEARWLWEIHSTARLMLNALVQDHDTCRSLMIKWGVEQVLDNVSPGFADVALRRLGIPQREEVLLDPLAKRLPEAENRFWKSVARDGLWFENVGEYLFDSIQIDVVGPLVEFAEVIGADYESYHWLGARLRQCVLHGDGRTKAPRS